MKERLTALINQYHELETELASPEVMQSRSRMQALARKHSELRPVVDDTLSFRKIEEEIAEYELAAAGEDTDLAQLAQEELPALREELETLDAKLQEHLLPKDPSDRCNTIMEIRAGAGGDEASLFCGDLFRMYSRYAERSGYKIDVADSNSSGVGGFKEIVYLVQGEGSYSRLKFEGGVHRVQRVPATEASGRIHTSTVTVAVLPEVETVEYDIDPNDLRIDVFRSSGPGGQSVNTTDSAVRITHVPTDTVVTCQDEKSQHKNKAKAMKVLRSRLRQNEKAKQAASVQAERRSMVGTGDRSEKIRTYNFPQNRVTDHRIGFTTHRLQEVLEGGLDETVDALTSEERLRLLAAHTP